jgi:hypothetical protein
VIFLADDSVSVAAEETQHDGDVGRSFGGQVEVQEYITAWLTTRDYLRLVSAKKLEVRMGTYTHTFKDDELEALRDLGARIVTAMAGSEQ